MSGLGNRRTPRRAATLPPEPPPAKLARGEAKQRVPTEEKEKEFKEPKLPKPKKERKEKEPKEVKEVRDIRHTGPPRCSFCLEKLGIKSHIKCLECEDTLICLKCYTLGTEGNKHKRGHPYQIPGSPGSLFARSWTYPEEQDLITTAQRFKLGNWDEVAATLSKTHGRKRLCEETSRHFQLYFVQSTLGQAAMKAREWIERRSDFITDINDLLNDPSGRELGYHAVIETLRALDDADLPDVNEKDLSEKLWKMTEKHFGTLSRLQKKRKASALSYRSYRSHKKAPFPYGEDDDEEWWIRDGKKKKPVKPAVHDESDDHDTIADEKDDELEEFIEEGGMEKILDMFQKAKLNEDPAVQESLSDHGEERPLPGQPQMKRVKWSGMKTRSDCSDDDSFLEKSRRDPSEIDLPDARAIPYSDGRRNINILMDIGVDGDLQGCKSGVIGRIQSIVEMEKEATPPPPFDPDQPVVHEIKMEIKEEEADDVDDYPVDAVANVVPIDEQEEQSEDEVNSTKTESDKDVSVVFDDENYEANMRAKGYGTDDMYSDWDDASKNEAVSVLKSLSKRGVLSDFSEVEDDQEEEIERPSSEDDDVAPRRARLSRARGKRGAIESSDDEEESSSDSTDDVITAQRPKTIPYHEIESEREQLDLLFGKNSEEPKLNKAIAKVKKTKKRVVKLFKLGSDGRYHADTEEIDEPIDDFLMDSVEEVGSKEWIVRRLNNLKQFYYDKDPESGRWHAKYPIPSVDSELDDEIDEYGEALFAHMEEERRANPPQDPDDVDMDRTPEARFGDDPDVKPTQEELEKLTVAPAAVDAQEPLTIESPEFANYLMEHFLEDMETSDEESVSSDQICDLIIAKSRLGHSPSPDEDDSEDGEDEDEEENESDDDARRTPDSALGDDEDEGEEDEDEEEEREEDEESHMDIKEEPMDAEPQEVVVKQEVKEENPDDGCPEDAPAPAAPAAAAPAADPVKEEPSTPEPTAAEPAPIQIESADEIKKEIKQEVKQEVKEEPQNDGYPTGAVLAPPELATPLKTPTPAKAPTLKSPSSVPLAKPAAGEKEIKKEIKEEPQDPKEPEAQEDPQDPEDDYESDDEQERPVKSPVPHALLLHTSGRRAYTIIPLQPAVITPREDYTKSRSTPPPCQPSSTPTRVLNVKEELPEEYEVGADRVPTRDRGHTPGRADLRARGLKVVPVGHTPVLLDPNDGSTSNTPEPFFGSTEASPEPAAKEIKEEHHESDKERTPPAVHEKTPEPALAPVAPVALVDSAIDEVKEEPIDDNAERVSTPGNSMGSPATPVGPNDLALEDFMDEPEGHTDDTEDDEATIDTAENPAVENPDDFNDDDLHGSFCNCRNCKYDRHEPLSDEEVGSDEERMMREQEEMADEEKADEYGVDEEMDEDGEYEQGVEDEMEDEMYEDEEAEEFDEREIKQEEIDDEEEQYADPPSPEESNHIPIPEDEIKQEEEDEEVECSKDHGDGLCGCEPCGNVRVSAVEEESDVEHDLTRKINKSGVMADVAAELRKNYVDDSDQSDGYDASSESNDEHSQIYESDDDQDSENEFHTTSLRVSTEDVDDYLTSHPSLSPSAFMTMKEAKEFVNKCNAEAKAIKEEDDDEDMEKDAMRSPSPSPEPERNNYINDDETLFHRDGEDYPISHPCLSPSAVIQPREADKLLKKCNAEFKKKEKEKKRQEKKEKQEEEERAIIQSMRRKGLRPDEKLDDERADEEKEEEKEEEEDKDKTPPMLHGDPPEDESESSQKPPEQPRTPLLVIKKVQKRGRTDLRVETRPRTAKEERKMEEERKKKEEEEKRVEKEEKETMEETEKKKKKKLKKEKHVEFREEKEEKKEEELISPPKKKIPRELQGLIMDNELRQYELTQSKSLKERASKAIGTQKEKFTRCGTTVHVSDSEPEIEQRIRWSKKKSKGDAAIRSKKIIEPPVVEDLPRSSRRVQQPTDPKRKPLAGPGKKANAASKKGAKTEEVKQNWSRGRKRPAEPYPVDESSDEEIPATPKKKGPQPKRRRKNKRVTMSKKERKAQWNRKVQNRKAREAEKADEKKMTCSVIPSQKARRRRQISQERLDAYRFLFRRLPYDYEDYGFRNRVNFKGWINDIYNMGYSQERDDYEVDFFNEGEQIVSRVNIINIGYRDLPHQIEAEVKIARAQRYFRVCQERRALRNYAAEYERVLAFLNLSMKMCAMTEKRKPKLRDIFRSRTAEEKFDGKLAQVLARDELLEMKQARTRLLKIRSRTEKLQQLHIAGKTTLDDLHRCYRYRRVCSEVASHVDEGTGDTQTIADVDDLPLDSVASDSSDPVVSYSTISLPISSKTTPARSSSSSANKRALNVIDAIVVEYGQQAVEAVLDCIIVALHDTLAKETAQRPNDFPEQQHKYRPFRPCSMEAFEVPICIAPDVEIAVGGGLCTGAPRQQAALASLFTATALPTGASSFTTQSAPVRSVMGGGGGGAGGSGGGAQSHAVGPPPDYSAAHIAVSTSQSAGSSARSSGLSSSSTTNGRQHGKFAASSNRSGAAKCQRERAALVPKIKDKKKKKEDHEMNEIRIEPSTIKPYLGSNPSMVVEIDLRPFMDDASTERRVSNHPSLTPSRECSRLPSCGLLPTPIVYKKNGDPMNRRILNGGHPWQRPDTNHHYRKRFPGQLRMLVLQVPRRPPCPDMPEYPGEPVMRGRFLGYSIIHRASKYAEMRKWADYSLANHRTYLRCVEEKKYDVLAQMGPFMPYFPYLPEYWISPAHVAHYIAGEKLQDRFRTIFHASADQHRGLFHPAGFRIEEGMLHTTARDWLREAVAFAHDTRRWHAEMPSVEDRDALLEHLLLLRDADTTAPRPALDADYNKTCGAYLPLPFRYVRYSPTVDMFDPADPYGAVELPHEWTRERPPRRDDDFRFSMPDPFRRGACSNLTEHSVWRELGQFAVSLGMDAIKCVCGAEEAVEEETEEEVLKRMIVLPLMAGQEKARIEWLATFHPWPNEQVPLTEELTKEQIERGVQLRALRYPQSTKEPTAPPLEEKKKVPVCFDNPSFDQSTSSVKDDDHDGKGDDGGGHFFDGAMVPPFAHAEQKENASSQENIDDTAADDLVDRISMCVIEPPREVLVEEELHRCSRPERSEDGAKEPLRRTEQGPKQRASNQPNAAMTRAVQEQFRRWRAARRNRQATPTRMIPRPSSISKQQMRAREPMSSVVDAE
ncbi:ada-2, partial [Pristionchus pacificus]